MNFVAVLLPFASSVDIPILDKNAPQENQHHNQFIYAVHPK
jgi:hypothetical protein